MYSGAKSILEQQCEGEQRLEKQLTIVRPAYVGLFSYESRKLEDKCRNHYD